MTSEIDPCTTTGAPLHPRLHPWTDRSVIGVALAALFAGFGQFGLVTALGDVARDFGRITHGASIADQVGLSGTELGIGLAIIRLASLGSLPFIGLADRYGRRFMLIGSLAVGLALTVASAASPGYWWFVVIFACGRPMLSTTNALAQVVAVEQTSARGRASAVALTAAGYGVGAGLIAIIHSLASTTLGFRGLFLLVLIPLLLIPVIQRWITEPDRFSIAESSGEQPLPVLGAVGPLFRRRLLVITLLAFAVSVITGPANSFVFLYAQNVLHQSGVVTAGMVVGAGVAGLIGLLAGRWCADHLGRRPTGAVAMIGLAAFGTLAYAGSSTALLVGYIMGVMAGSMFAPPAGALLTELFPTSVRASVAGWSVAAGVLGAGCGLVAFGAIADVGNRFAMAAALTFLPAGLAAALFWLVPETRGTEPEDLWPVASAASGG
jgi:SHS family lactate transporter-like MFS transporter